MGDSDYNYKIRAGLLQCEFLARTHARKNRVNPVIFSQVLFLFLAFSSQSACSSKLDVNAVKAANTATMQVLARYPVVVKAGERVELKGLGFKNTLALALFDASGVAITQSLPVKVENATAASFRVPETAQPGIYQLSASQDGQSQTLSLVFTADMLDEAIFARDAKNVCAGQKFYDLDGNVREGNKLCEAKTSSTSTSTNSDRSVTPPECSRDGETGCLAVTNFPAVDKINKLTPGNIKSGVTIAEVSGAYPSAQYRLAGADSNMSDLPAFVDTAGGASYEWFQSDGTRLSGSIQANAEVTPGATTQTLLAGLYRSVTVAGDSNLADSNIKSGVGIFGVVGTMAPRAANCASDGQTSCTTVAAFPAIDTNSTTHPTKILFGQSILGINGSYAPDFPAVANVRANDTVDGTAGTLLDCTAANQDGCVATSTYKTMNLSAAGTETGLNASNFDTTIAAASSFEFWDAAGARHTVAGDSDLIAQNIRLDTEIHGKTGTMLERAADCNSDGKLGCTTVAAYPAIDKTGLADKVLSTTSVAGVTGNVTLPAVGKVFSNISYGVGGTSLVGTLTLPPANYVWHGSPNYGDPSVPLTPSYDPAGYPPIIARPGTPSITGSSFDFNPDRITLSWSAATGATGYIVLMKSGSAVSWTPSDLTTYTTGAYDSDTMIYSGSGNTVTYTTPVTAGLTHYFAVYAYETNKVYSATAATKMVLSCAGLVGGTWVDVPGDSVYETDGFCVQKYIPSNLNRVPVSQSGTSPWLSISQATAKSTCAGLGSGYHLITNPEWMTIAANIANTPSNWSNGQVGSGTLSRGHSDSDPNTVCPANADDNLAWVANDCGGQTQGTNAFNQRRTQNLSNGSVIWDFGGNAQQFVDYFNANDKPTPGGGLWYEFTVINPSTTTPRSHLVPIRNVQPWWDDSWNSAQSIGKIYPVNQDSGGALTRGGTKSDGAAAGLFAFSLYLNDVEAPGAPVANSFRCAWRP